MAMNTERPVPRATATRANFMIFGLTTLIGMVAMAYVAPILGYLWPSKNAASIPLSLTRDGDNLTDPASGTVYPQTAGIWGPITYDATGHGDAQGIFLVPDSKASAGYLALEQTCRHLGCPVAYSNGVFNCPCHGSVYTKEGEVVKGPAAQPLYHHAVATKGSTFTIAGREA